MIRIPQKSKQRIPVRVERRSQTVSNRLRRFSNDFWLVPVLVIYLQLLAALMTATGDGEPSLLEKNQTFLSGVPRVAQIVSYEFPFALIGHSKEMLHTFGGVSASLTPAEVAQRIEDKKRNIYLELWASRDYLDTEVGGVVNLQPGRDVGFYSIPSSNGAFLNRLKAMTPEAALDYLVAPENQEIVDILAGNRSAYKKMSRIVTSSAFSEETKKRVFASAIYALEVASEARYVVLPIDFKAQLGHMDVWRYAGLYHFHNELNSPPSEADINSSYDVRQFVFCLAKDGFDLYDIEAGQAHITHYEVLPEAWVTQPEWFELSAEAVPI